MTRRCLCCAVLLASLLLLSAAISRALAAIPGRAYAMRGFSLADNSAGAGFRQQNADYLAKYLMSTNRKRSCVRRGGSCDHRPSDCCDNSSCRCNLWGTNCRCQRMGLFQKWG